MKQKYLGPLIIFAVILSFWELVRVAFRLPEIILPPLTAIALAVVSEPRFFTHCFVTLCEAIVGFIIGNVVAILVSVLILRWRSLEAALMPYAIALKTTPVAAIAPILILWFGGGWLSKAAAAASVCFFPTLVNLVRGLRMMDAGEYQEYRELFACWGISWWKTLLHLRGPFALPLFFSALKMSSSLALVGAIVGEFIAADVGIGYLVVVYSRRLETASMFAAVFSSTILGVLWFYVIVLCERRLSKRFGTLASREELL